MSEQLPLRKDMRRRIGAYLLVHAAELESSFFDPKKKRATPASIAKEIATLRRWAYWLRK